MIDLALLRQNEDAFAIQKHLEEFTGISRQIDKQQSIANIMQDQFMEAQRRLDQINDADPFSAKNDPFGLLRMAIERQEELNRIDSLFPSAIYRDLSASPYPDLSAEPIFRFEHSYIHPISHKHEKKTKPIGFHTEWKD